MIRVAQSGTSESVKLEACLTSQGLADSARIDVLGAGPRGIGETSDVKFRPRAHRQTPSTPPSALFQTTGPSRGFPIPCIRIMSSEGKPQYELIMIHSMRSMVLRDNTMDLEFSSNGKRVFGEVHWLCLLSSRHQDISMRTVTPNALEKTVPQRPVVFGTP
ncbi:hypothetical protein BGZ60DRAFT_435274 [Tricladium varicosporioides]|nr:hypothetical protein BGZ60DRAFT_435274 [Hymenoscyphus varicosporioides]